MSWFWRGFQSAVFYYLSCAPCMTYAHQRKRAKANRRARAIKAAQRQTEGVYVHPSPFDTNVYWHEEMVLGPGPPQRKGNRDRNKTDSTRRLNTGGQGSSGGGSSADTTLVVQSFDGVREEEEDHEEEGWNRRRYQRADELLWGQDDPNIASYVSFGSSVASRPIVNENGTYYSPRNPVVSDLHPPVVSTQPPHPNQTRWMLQPPPSAKVMEGKERANRSRSASTASYNNSSRGTGGAIAGSQVSLKKSIEIPKKDGLTMDERGSSNEKESTSVKNIQGQRHDRLSDSSTDSETPAPTPTKKKRPPPIRVIEDAKKSAIRTRSATSRSRPKLDTIQSSENGLTDLKAKKLLQSAPSSSSHLAAGHDTLPSASSSLQALQDLIPTGTSLRVRAPSPSHAASIKLPSATEAEKHFLALPEVASKFPGNDSFHFPLAQPGRESKEEPESAGQRRNMDTSEC